MAIGDRSAGSDKPVSEQSVVIRTQDGDCPARVFAPDAAGQWPAVIFLMDGYGMRQTLVDMARQLSACGFVVLLPDLYYRAGPYAPATVEEIRDPAGLQARLGPWIMSTDNLKAAADAKAFLDYFDSRSDVLGKGVGVVGYCLSGGMALTIAATYPERIRAAASFHGGGLATDAPTSPHQFVHTAKARILVAAADQDPYYPAAMNERLKAALDEAGADYAIDVYQGAHHGWTMQDFPVYNPAAAERHREALITLLRETLG